MSATSNLNDNINGSEVVVFTPNMIVLKPLAVLIFDIYISYKVHYLWQQNIIYGLYHMESILW